MADIAMCLNTLCPLANTCYRRTAQPNEHWQNYQFFEYQLTGIGIICHHFKPTSPIRVSNHTQTIPKK